MWPLVGASSPTTSATFPPHRFRSRDTAPPDITTVNP
jgi:hypothetical protein